MKGALMAQIKELETMLVLASQYLEQTSRRETIEFTLD
jgi:hypothetical protein